MPFPFVFFWILFAPSEVIGQSLLEPIAALEIFAPGFLALPRLTDPGVTLARYLYRLWQDGQSQIA